MRRVALGPLLAAWVLGGLLGPGASGPLPGAGGPAGVPPLRAQTPSPGPLPAQEARIDSIFAPYDHTRSPGCAVGVARGGGWVFRRGYGMASLEYGVPITPATVFRTGSVSKQFTAAAILLLEDDGALSLDDDVRRFLPELPDYGTPVRIRHLIHHTSGIRDYLTLMTLAGKREDDFYTDEEVLTLLSRQRELNFPPGEEFLYSNSGYLLLSWVVRRASGRSLREFAGERLFGPLGMTHTHFHDDHTHVVPGRATGYAPRPGGGFRVAVTTLDMVGDGGVFTSIDDLLPWIRNLREPRVGGPDFGARMLRRGVLNRGDTLDYAFGLVHGTYRGLRTVGHGGSFVGYRAALLLFPDEDLAVACLCNLSTANPGRLARRVAEVFLEGRMGPEEPPEPSRPPAEEAPEPVPLPPSALEPLAGTYYSPELDAVYRIRREGADLLLRVGNRLDGALVPVGEGEFRRGGLTLRFLRGPEGVAGFLLDAGRVKHLRFERLPRGPVP